MATASTPLTEQAEEGQLSAMAHTLDLRSRASQGGHRYCEVPMMKGDGEIVIDDKDTTIVIVLDYDTEADRNDPSALDVMIENPMEKAAKIFDRSINQYSAGWKDTGVDNLKKGPVTKREYRSTVWTKMLQLLEQSGFKVSSTESIDKDQVFLRIALQRDGSVIQQLAQRFRYSMNYNEEAYKTAQPLGSWYEGGKAPVNYDDDHVTAAANYKIAAKDKFVEFTEVDEIRLIMWQIAAWIDTDELIAQGIIVGVFPMHNFDTVVELNKQWASLNNITSLPDHHSEDLVREYFGEKIAFLVMWIVSYTRALAPLACVGILGVIAKIPGMPLSFQRGTRWLFCGLICVWAAVFNQTFKNRTARVRQKWCAEGSEDRLRTRGDWDPSLEGTWGLTVRKMGVQVGALLYLIAFVYVIGLIANMRRSAKEHNTTDFSEVLITIVIQAGGWIYGRTAAIWVSMQNHRVQNHWEDAVSVQLVLVKLFIALYPFINFAFLQHYTDVTCGTSLKDAAAKVYVGESYPKGMSSSDLKWLDTDTFRYVAGSQTCIYGCFPETCQIENGKPVCVTNCVSLLESALLMNFVTVNFITIGLMLAPIFIIRAKIFMEKRKMAEAIGSDSLYTWLQLQAKQLEVTPYEYYSWGGSVMEDFLEYVVAFSLVVCFGMMLPLIAIVAFLSTMVYARLGAFRFANVTSRPFPDVKDGIGVWQKIITTVCTIACIINAGLVTFVMPPIRDWPRTNRLLAFLALQHLLLFVQTFVGFVLPDEPEDVRLINDINGEFSEAQIPKVLKSFSDEAKADYSEVNLALKDD